MRGSQQGLAILLVLSLGLLCGAAPIAFNRTYANCKVINSANDVRLYWNITGNTINVGFYGKFAGYVAIAFSGDGLMSGKPKGFCDNWVVTKKGTVLDTYFSGESQVKNDTKNDFTWTYFSSNTSYLVGEFDRLLVTGDNRDYDITPGTGQGLIWAGAKSFSGTSYPDHKANYGSSFVDFGAPTSCDAPSTPGGFSSSTGFKVTWTLDDAKTMINFTMSYNNAGSGWLAIGISSTPLMTNSDMYSGWITNNVVTLYDGWCTGQTVPAADTTSNIIPGSVSGSVVGGLTTISFSRLIDTGDSAKDYTITSSPAALMVAWGPCTTGCAVGNYPKHTAYDSAFVNFLSTNGSASPPPSSDGVTVPNDPTKDPVGTTLSNADGSFTVTYQIVADKIIFKMVATTTGWISIGFSGGAMYPADIYVGWIYPDGKVHFRDQWADSYLTPVDDAQQDATILSASEANGKTSITFSRPCTTTDNTKDKNIYDPNLTKIIWALSPTDGNAYSYPKHSVFGSIPVDFLAGPPGSPSSAPPTPANAWIDSRKRFYVSWKITDADATITFNVTVQTNGWISIAFGRDNGPITMLGLDAIIGWIDPSGTAYAKDCICDSSSKILPIVDTTDNILSFSGSQANGYTSIVFTRKLDTGDAQDYPITNVALMVAVAWAPTLPSSYAKRDAQVLTYDVHSAWDATKLNFFSTAPLPPPPSGTVVNNTVNGTAPKGNNQYSNGQFKVSYEIDASETWVTFLMSAPTLGWISIGLNSRNNKMKTADTYTGWITDGQVYFYDELSDSYGQPIKDTSQDAVVLAAEEIDGWTTIVFKRKLVTGDKDNDVDLYNTEFIIFASDALDGSPTGNYPEHDYYGSKAIDFGLANGFAAADPGYMLTAGDILLIIMFVVMIVWGLIRLIAVLIKRSHYSSYQFDQPAATYTNVQQLYQQMDGAVDQQNEVEMVENAPREASGVEFHAGHYDGNTYVRLSPEERAGGLKLKHDSGVVASVKGILEYRFHSTQVTLGDVIAFTIFIGFNAAAFFLTKAEEWNTINGAAISLGSLVGGNAVFIVMFATRHSALVYLLGIPFDRAILFHRWLGRWSGIVLFLHFIFESIFFSQNLPAGSNDTAICKLNSISTLSLVLFSCRCQGVGR
eukprot:TRINITY_DN1257_c0_g1_i11.p1 TRINITY_DN1257_c0_g1~~TRINITY_DN1257_c0_g1_i11.p1  ORF type:complete len:1135 (+),score=161.40 TRINITY_DN1257_c0_g1_i11:40-3444(+)